MKDNLQCWALTTESGICIFKQVIKVIRVYIFSVI